MAGKLHVGDIFEFSIDPTLKGLGQILGIYKGMEYLIAVFREAYPKELDVRGIELSPNDILLVGISLDAKFHHGHWAIVDIRAPILDESNLPLYRVKEGDKFLVVDFQKTQVSGVAEAETSHAFRTTWSPAAFEVAFKAKHSKAEWLSDFDQLLYRGTSPESKA